MANDNNWGGARPGAGRKKKNPDGSFEHTAFTAEQLKELTDSPCVAYVSSKSVSYTKVFKNAAWQRYCDDVDPIQIFADVGLNPETLGRPRILGFFKTLRQVKGRGLEFVEGNDPYPNDNEDVPPYRCTDSLRPGMPVHELQVRYNTELLQSSSVHVTEG